jgi:chemotaxis family two-component system response regulator Rcp1
MLYSSRHTVALMASETGITEILIVEDNPVDVRLLRLALESVEDWVVRTSVAVDGEEAINYLLDPETSKPDFVVLDLNLPKRDGFEVLQVIRITNNLYGLPVVVFSSSTEDVFRTKMQEAEMDAEYYLSKPAGVDEFLAIGPTLRRFYEQAVNK